ncbi:MAG: hypothetical protein GEU81_10210 [Nitriliruptorales bacterium]|nr:hypothetical protein [Nitriliruptorales bacterium]
MGPRPPTVAGLDLVGLLNVERSLSGLALHPVERVVELALRVAGLIPAALRPGRFWLVLCALLAHDVAPALETSGAHPAQPGPGITGPAAQGWMFDQCSTR